MNTRCSMDSTVALITTVAFVASIAAVMFHLVPDANRDMANVLLGALAAKFTDVVGFYFGSSRNPQQQQAQQPADAAKSAPPTTESDP